MFVYDEGAVRPPKDFSRCAVRQLRHLCCLAAAAVLCIMVGCVPGATESSNRAGLEATRDESSGPGCSLDLKRMLDIGEAKLLDMSTWAVFEEGNELTERETEGYSWSLTIYYPEFTGGVGNAEADSPSGLGRMIYDLTLAPPVEYLLLLWDDGVVSNVEFSPACYTKSGFATMWLNIERVSTSAVSGSIFAFDTKGDVVRCIRVKR